MIKLLNFSQALSAMREGYPICRQSDPDVILGLLPPREEGTVPIFATWARGDMESMQRVAAFFAEHVLAEDWGIAVEESTQEVFTCPNCLRPVDACACFAQTVEGICPVAP